jgi:hypothetical protein
MIADPPEACLVRLCDPVVLIAANKRITPSA